MQDTSRPALAGQNGSEKALRRRNEVLDAAAEIFAKKGYHAATTRDIAERIGMQAGLAELFLSGVCVRSAGSGNAPRCA